MSRRRSFRLGLQWTLTGVSLWALLGGGLMGVAAAQAKPEGEMRWALYVTIAPAWLDPG